jgi:hypothetical protein
VVDILQQIWAVIAVILALGMCLTVFYLLFTGRHDRDREEEAREFFDRHGHWPDEEPT